MKKEKYIYVYLSFIEQPKPLIVIEKVWPEQCICCSKDLFSINVLTVLYVLCQIGCLEQICVTLQIVIRTYLQLIFYSKLFSTLCLLL